MRHLKRSAIAAYIFGLSPANGQVSRVCPTNDPNICYSLNIPNTTAASGNGDIYIQIQAPSSSYEWLALGQGSSMRGSQFFVLYLSADGGNVTVSPRLGTGHVQPQNSDSITQSSGIALIDGTTVQNGLITANFRCSGCINWTGGSMDFTSTNAAWNFAHKTGTPIQSNDLTANIDRHDEHGEFTWDLTTAKGTSTQANPFVASNVNITETTPVVSSTGTTSNTIIIAHAVLACLTVALILPLGSILIRIARFPEVLQVHMAIQMLGLAMFVAAFGLGAYYATMNGYWMTSHTIIGSVILALILCQPLLGLFHHNNYKQVQRRGLPSWLHIGSGRIVVFLGIVNGGLGLRLAHQSIGAKVGYGVGAGIIGLLYLAAIIIGERRRSSAKTYISEGSSFQSDDGQARPQQQYVETK